MNQLQYLYTAIIYLLIPFVLVRLLLISIKHKSYRARWCERFGLINWRKHNRPVIWIHAVSVGEVNAAKLIINSLQKKYPNYQIVITTITPTGSKIAQQQHGDNVDNFYLPYDIPYCVNKFITTINPSILITMETEIWPNLFQCCYNYKVPIIIANARLSQKSMHGYRFVSGLTERTLKLVSKIAAQSIDDADRFIMLGATKETVSVVGNLKFDIEIPQSIIEKAEPLRHYFSVNRPIWIAASTHEGEEKIILKSHKIILSCYPDAILILAPRHPERTEKISLLCKKKMFSSLRRTENQSFNNSHNVFLLDTVGELQLYYAASQVAFVGGSLLNIGGQNILEPASLNLPVITGPHTHNFEEIKRLLLENNALVLASTAVELADKVQELLSDANKRHNMGERAKSVILANRGSSKKVVSQIEGYLVN